MTIRAFIVGAALASVAALPSQAQVTLPNGHVTGPNLVQVSFCYGQDSGDGSGMVVKTAQTKNGGIKLFVYTGPVPQYYLYCRVPLDPNIIPPTTSQPNCQATLADIYYDETYLFGYTPDGEWPFGTFLSIDGSENLNNIRYVNVWAQVDWYQRPMTYNVLPPSSALVINLLCPPGN